MLSLLALLHAPSAFAQDVVHPQANFTLEGTRPLTDALSLRGSGHIFWAPGPGEDVAIGLMYLGPKIKVTDWFSIAPQVGMVTNWTGNGDLQPMLSAWSWIGSGRLRGFVESDGFISLEDGTPTYYGFYAVDYSFKLIDVGPQVEQTNASFSAGGHAGLPLGDHVYLQLSYFRGLDAVGTNNLRWALTVAL